MAFSEPVHYVCVELADGRTLHGHWCAETSQLWTAALDKPITLPADTPVRTLVPPDLCVPPALALDGMDFCDVTSLTSLCVRADDAATLDEAAAVARACNCSVTRADGALVIDNHDAVVAHKLAARCKGIRFDVGKQTAQARVRVRASHMRAPKPEDVARAFAQAANAVHQHYVLESGQQDVIADTVYTEAAQRAQLTWAHLGVWVSKRKALADDEALFEPLNTCVRVWKQVDDFRHNRTQHVTPPASFPCAARITNAQLRHAHALFYWCYVHRDAPTLPASRLVLQRALEMYLRFGLVLSRKRAYEFRREPATKRMRLEQ